MGFIPDGEGGGEGLWWYPEGVTEPIAASWSYFIGKMDDSTVLKFLAAEEGDPYDKWNDRDEAIAELRAEQRIYERVGDHPRIISFKGWQESGPGLRLEYAPNKDLESFLKENPDRLSARDRLRILKETAEGIDFIHSKNVIIRDIALRNILLDADLHVKLCDLTGNLLGDDGAVIVHGSGWEDFDATKPRPDKMYADISTDLFAFGTAIYKLMARKDPFPDTEDDKEMKRRFEQREYPELDERLGGKVVWGCWDSSYKSAGEIAKDLEELEQACQS